MKRETSGGRRLGKGLACLAAAFSLGVFLPGEARGIDRIAVSYGLREYFEYTDNLLDRPEGDDGSEKISDIAINTAPDISILYDDGQTRWLARGTFRRESFLENSDASGNFWATSGEFSRALNNRVTFSLVGGFDRTSSQELGRALSEPGQRAVVRPIRGETTTGTFWSPSLTVFWSRRFSTTLSYEDNQSFTPSRVNLVDRTISLSSIYGLTPRTTLKGFLIATTNRNSGVAFIDRQDVNSFVARFGFVRIFNRKLTVDVSAGPQWTKDVNLPDKVTLLRNTIVQEVVDPVLGLTEDALLKEPGREVEDLSVGLSVNLQVSYQMNPKTFMSLLLTRGTTSGEGASGTQETLAATLNITRSLSSDWFASLRASVTTRESVLNELAILVAKDPKTGEVQAFDRKTFDIGDRFKQRQITIEPSLNYRINKWMSAYASWNWTELKEESLGSRTRVNRVQLGLEFRRNAFY